MEPRSQDTAAAVSTSFCYLLFYSNGHKIVGVTMTLLRWNVCVWTEHDNGIGVRLDRYALF